MPNRIRFLTICCLIGFVLVACRRAAPLPTPTSTVTPAPTPTHDLSVKGRQVFGRVCASCHGENAEGYGNELAAPALDDGEHAFEHPDQQIHDWIVKGKLGLGRQMPALGNQLSEEELHAVIDYLHSLWTPEQLEVQQSITSRWPTTPVHEAEP